MSSRHSQLGGVMPITRAASDLRAVALHSLRDAQAVHPECAFQFEADGDLSGEFDASRMQQVITNLLTNAAQYRNKHYAVTLSLAGEAEQLTLQVKTRGSVTPAQAFKAIRFDMSEFSAEHADQRLIGAPPGYIGYDAGGDVRTRRRMYERALLYLERR